MMVSSSVLLCFATICLWSTANGYGYRGLGRPGGFGGYRRPWGFGPQYHHIRPSYPSFYRGCGLRLFSYCRPYASYLAIQDFDQCDRMLLWHKGDNCEKFVKIFELESVEDLMFLNPTLDCTKTDAIGDGSVMCAAAASVARNASETNRCAEPIMVLPGDNCDKLAANYPLLKSLNGDDVNLDICGVDNKKPMAEGEILCAKLANPLIKDVSCEYWYVVKGEEKCDKVALDHNLLLARLLELNPELDCNNLRLGQMLCVSEATPN